MALKIHILENNNLLVLHTNNPIWEMTKDSKHIFLKKDSLMHRTKLKIILFIINLW